MIDRSTHDTVPIKANLARINGHPQSDLGGPAVHGVVFTQRRCDAMRQEGSQHCLRYVRIKQDQHAVTTGLRGDSHPPYYASR